MTRIWRVEGNERVDERVNGRVNESERESRPESELESKPKNEKVNEEPKSGRDDHRHLVETWSVPSCIIQHV